MNNYWAVINLHVRNAILFKSVLVGILAGIVVCAYRYSDCSEEWSYGFIAHCRAFTGHSLAFLTGGYWIRVALYPL